ENALKFAATAIAEGAAPDNERAAQVIAAESRRLERLVADLLELAKLDARRFSLEVRPVDVAEVVADTAEGFRPAADEAGLALTVTVPGPGALRTDTDPDRLAQVVANLVENALKFAATAIAVSAGANDEGGVTVVVEDDGPGIPTDERGRAFDRLHQSSRTPARRVGSGLGLAIVSELVGAMGGQVRAEPGTGGAGTRMVVDLR
ncbi:MAG TPA: HAMP domain-containing sensor histidine kinase, partial [Acidimicrobiales bacterium]|nr:HAMP domain-containing sensor histidine kinase [Acidimicrobiales bacterium]